MKLEHIHGRIDEWVPPEKDPDLNDFIKEKRPRRELQQIASYPSHARNDTGVYLEYVEMSICKLFSARNEKITPLNTRIFHPPAKKSTYIDSSFQNSVLREHLAAPRGSRTRTLVVVQLKEATLIG